MILIKHFLYFFLCAGILAPQQIFAIDEPPPQIVASPALAPAPVSDSDSAIPIPTTDADPLGLSTEAIAGIAAGAATGLTGLGFAANKMRKAKSARQNDANALIDSLAEDPKTKRSMSDAPKAIKAITNIQRLFRASIEKAHGENGPVHGRTRDDVPKKPLSRPLGYAIKNPAKAKEETAAVRIQRLVRAKSPAAPRPSPRAAKH